VANLQTLTKEPDIRKRRQHARPQTIRLVNRNSVLRLVRQGQGISKTEISDSIGLSRMAANEIVEELLHAGLIIENGEGESTGGRRPTLYKLNPSGAYVVGADVGLDEMSLAVVDLEAKIKAKVTVDTCAELGVEAVFDNLVAALDKLFEESGIQRDKISALGMGFPGDMRVQDGVCIRSRGLGWQNVQVRKIVEDKTGIPTLVDSNVRARSIGEHWFGIARDVNDFVFILIRGAVGGAVIIGGRQHNGFHGRAGYLGHDIIHPDGPLCFCGNRGCLAAYVSSRSITQRIRKRIEGGEKTLITVDDNESRIQFMERLFQAAKKNDHLAQEIVEELVYYLSLGIAGTVNNFDPEMVVLSGYVIDKSQNMLLDKIRNEVTSMVFESDSRKIRIEQSSLGENAGVIGAASLIYQNYFEIPLVQG
jgi:N-acetylglucosamine repressor